MTEKEPLWVISTIPGRMRLRFRADKSDEPDLAKFLTIRGIEEVTFTEITKSLLIIYNAKIISKDELFKEIEKTFPKIKLCFDSEEQGIEGNALSQLIYSYVGKINKCTNKSLKGYADLTSIIPTALLLWGIEELIRNPVMPRWYDIMRAAETMFFNSRGQHSIDTDDTEI
ncbi:MAG: hypothetical protein IMZ52_01255 [Actinobacteria bacterium]|nr:hypothetical protein [Candidatus Atribacteria bacterium]MBE3093629.1 hypothetical protein [Actinomycetota bacterium]MBE3127073.1 hypothetical protein [Candidatus Atribacteria bacterium]